MRAEILAVGTELLLGDILNTNAQYLARELAAIGITVYHQSVVGDNRERLLNAYESAFERCELVITTGGLGPTKDDLTKETAAEFFNRELILHRPSLERLESMFAKMNRRMSENNIKQVYFPNDAIILPNDNGTAPGCILEEGDKILINLPGPPREVVPMFEKYVIPHLKNFQDGVLVSRVLRTCGIGESSMEEMVIDLINTQTNPTIAPYAKEGEAILRITASAKNETEAKNIIAPVEKEIMRRLGENIYGVDDTNLETVVGQMLVENNLTISTAESCTGGLLAGRLINYPGISRVYLEGAITYSNEAKIARLKVSKETIETYGAVSSETAGEMAEGIARVSSTDIGISVTGIAGPGGGTESKPVGLVYLGLYICGKVKTKELRLSGNRESIRDRTVIHALDWLRKELLHRE